MRIPLFLVNLILGLAALPLSAGPTVFTLPNGLETVVFPRPDIPLVSLQFSIRHGYIYADNPKDEGIAHLYEHMLFKANSLTKSQLEFMRRLNEIGAAGWNGSTGGEAVNYYLTVPASEIEPALKLWSAVLIDTVFNADELRREISVVSNEIEGNRRDPVRAFWRSFNQALYGKDQVYRTGHYETAQMAQFTREILLREQSRWYRPDNCMIGLSGAIEDKEALRLVAKYFGRWKKGSTRPRISALRTVTPQSNLVIGGFTNPAMLRLILAWSGPSILKERGQTLAADVLSYYLSEKSGPFLTSLMSKTALFSPDSTSFGFSTGRYNSEFIFQGEIPTTNRKSLASEVSRLQSTVTTSLAEIASGRHVIPAEALSRIAARIVNQRIFRQEKPAALLQDIGWWWCTADLKYWQGYDRGIAAVSAQEIQQLAKQWLSSPPLSVLWGHDSITNHLSFVSGGTP